MESPLTIKELLTALLQEDPPLLIKVTDDLLAHYTLSSPDLLELLEIHFEAVDHYKVSFRSTDPVGDKTIYYLEIHANGYEISHGVPCFVLSEETKVTYNNWTAATLKQYNSMQSSTNCGKCNQVLKELYPGMKFCSSCEP